MGDRYDFICWNCGRTYSIFKEITDEQELFVPCPFCNAEAVVKLEPYKKKIVNVHKGKTGEEQVMGYEYQFPKKIPTQKPDPESH